jgi:NTP pyrophosphatase (non-canonical NTP hydrolase)
MAIVGDSGNFLGAVYTRRKKMELDQYQRQANSTDQTADKDETASWLTSVLGLAGRSGALATEYLRYVRDGAAYQAFNQHIGDTLGDLLWYIANIASKNNFSLEQIAQLNLKKTASLWGAPPHENGVALDSKYPPSERFPRQFEIEVASAEREDAKGTKVLQLTYQGGAFGDPLTDNAAVEDGYRFHDMFHLSFVAHLCWSPVLRGNAFFDCKRRSDKDTDEIQDGGRAAVIDEAIAALIFNEARKNSNYENVHSVSIQLLQLIAQLTSHLEVSCRTMGEWNHAILNAFNVWRQVKAHPNGRLIGDLDAQTLVYVPH